MVVGLLKKGLKGSLPVLIVLFIFTIFLSYYSSTPSISDNSVNVLYSYLIKLLPSKSVLIVFNILVLAMGALLLSLYTIRQELTDKQNYIPAFVYVFFYVLISNSKLIHPSAIANVFILLSLIYISNTYREENILAPIFNTAFFISISMFFYINYAFFIFLFFISLLLLRAFNWREWTVGIIGLLVPVFIYYCLGYLFNFSYTEFIVHVGNLFYYFQRPLISEYFYPLFGFLIVILFIIFAKHLKYGLGSKIKTQKNFGIIYWLLLLSLPNFFSKNNNYYLPIIASLIPLSILLGDYYYNIKQLKVANTLFFLFIACGSLIILVGLKVI